MGADELEGFWEQAQEALGVFVGPATQDDVIDALTGHVGVFVAYLHTDDGSLVWQKFSRRGSHARGVNEDDEGELVLVFARDPARGGEQDVAGYPYLLTDAPLVLSFTDARKEALSANRYSGGVQMHLTGPRGAHTLTILLWHDVEHITDSGDIAPGLGAFHADIDAEP